MLNEQEIERASKIIDDAQPVMLTEEEMLNEVGAEGVMKIAVLQKAVTSYLDVVMHTLDITELSEVYDVAITILTELKACGGIELYKVEE